MSSSQGQKWDLNCGLTARPLTADSGDFPAESLGEMEERRRREGEKEGPHIPVQLRPTQISTRSARLDFLSLILIWCWKCRAGS